MGSKLFLRIKTARLPLQTFILICVVFLPLSTTGCLSRLFNSHLPRSEYYDMPRGDVLVESDPQGAKIIVNDTDSGNITPSFVTLNRDYTKHNITVAKDGYAPRSFVVYAVKTDAAESAYNNCLYPDGGLLTGCLSPFQDSSPYQDYKFEPNKLKAVLYENASGIEIICENKTSARVLIYLEEKFIGIVRREGNFIPLPVGEYKLKFVVETEDSLTVERLVIENRHSKIKIKAEELNGKIRVALAENQKHAR